MLSAASMCRTLPMCLVLIIICDIPALVAAI